MPTIPRNVRSGYYFVKACGIIAGRISKLLVRKPLFWLTLWTGIVMFFTIRLYDNPISIEQLVADPGYVVQLTDKNDFDFIVRSHSYKMKAFAEKPFAVESDMVESISIRLDDNTDGTRQYGIPTQTYTSTTGITNWRTTGSDITLLFGSDTEKVVIETVSINYESPAKLFLGAFLIWLVVTLIGVLIVL
jgi:hypothetical protein